MESISEKEKLELEERRLDIKKKRAEMLEDKRKSSIELRKLVVDEKRIVLDTAKALIDMLCGVTVEDSASQVGQEMKFKPIVTQDEAQKVKKKIDDLIKRI